MYLIIRVEDEIVALLLQDARELLPELLSTPTCVDSILLSRQLPLPTVEQMTEQACAIVRGAIEIGARELIQRREALLVARTALEAGASVVRDIDAIINELGEYADKVNQGYVVIQQELSKVTANAANAELVLRHSAEVSSTNIISYMMFVIELNMFYC